MKQIVNIAISPCPNDIYIFAALLNNKIDTGDISFKFHVHDIEELNKSALKGCYDVTKLSFHAYLHLSNEYVCLTNGNALCNNFGPIIVSTKAYTPKDFPRLKIAVPGMLTTAALIYKLFFGYKSMQSFLFSEIENAVLEEKADMGIVIHENVFSFKEKGLCEILNLGQHWQNQYKLPIPLGTIAVKREMDSKLQAKIDVLIFESFFYALYNRTEIWPLIKSYAQNLDDDIIEKHIITYVNEYSVFINTEGCQSVELLFNIAKERGIINTFAQPIFIKHL